MGAIFQQAAFMEDEDTVCHPNRRKAVGDEHSTFVFGQFDEAAEDLVSARASNAAVGSSRISNSASRM